MYKVKNVTFQKARKKYGVSSIYQLKKSQIRELCDKHGINIDPGFNNRKKGEMGRKKGRTIDKTEMVDQLMANFTYSIYMGEPYWEDRHFQLNDDVGLLEKIARDETGDETFDRFSKHRMGYHNLRPGDEQTLDVTKDFVDQILMNRPEYINKNLIIENLREHKDIETDEDAEARRLLEKAESYEKMTYNQLKAAAGRRGSVKASGTKGELIAKLKKDDARQMASENK